MPQFGWLPPQLSGTMKPVSRFGFPPQRFPPPGEAVNPGGGQGWRLGLNSMGLEPGAGGM